MQQTLVIHFAHNIMQELSLTMCELQQYTNTTCVENKYCSDNSMITMYTHINTNNNFHGHCSGVPHLWSSSKGPCSYHRTSFSTLTTSIKLPMFKPLWSISTKYHYCPYQNFQSPFSTCFPFTHLHSNYEAQNFYFCYFQLCNMTFFYLIIYYNVLHPHTALHIAFVNLPL